MPPRNRKSGRSPLQDNPMGLGEKKHPHEGNALLYTRDLKGNKVKNFLWLTQISTDLNMQIDATQKKRGMSYRPVRLGERFLSFTCVYSLQKREDYTKLLNNLIAHWENNMQPATQIPFPMTLVYYGANRIYTGNVEQGSIRYAVEDVVLSYQMMMRLFPQANDKDSHFMAKLVGDSAPYVPTIADVESYGPNWFSIPEQNGFLGN